MRFYHKRNLCETWWGLFDSSLNQMSHFKRRISCCIFKLINHINTIKSPLLLKCIPLSYPYFPLKVKWATLVITLLKVTAHWKEKKNPIISQEYQRPLLEAEPRILSRRKIRPIFFRVREITQCHCMFQIALASRVAEWDASEKIGDLFVASVRDTLNVSLFSPTGCLSVGGALTLNFSFTLKNPLKRPLKHIYLCHNNLMVSKQSWRAWMSMWIFTFT